MTTMIDRICESYKVQQTLIFGSGLIWSMLAPLRRLWLPITVRTRRKVNIHFGCGDIADRRFINIDARPMAHVHLVTKSPMLRPLRSGSADSFYACHVLEHFSFHEQRAVLKRWHAILKPGGEIRLSVPDFDKLVDKFLNAERNTLSIQATLMGAQDYPGNFHFAIFNRVHLTNLLSQCGFVEIVDWHPRDQEAWPKDHSWSDGVSLNLTARKP